MFGEGETITVSMSHKAYAFDWSAFARDELHSILLDALSSGDTNGLVRYIEANRDHLKDCYQGGPLSDKWKDMLENFDVHEFGDFALTHFMTQRNVCCRKLTDPVLCANTTNR